MKRKILCQLLSILLLVPILQMAIVTSNATSSTIDPTVRNVYYLRNKKSGLYLDLQGSNAVSSTELQQYPFGYPSEMFQLVYTANGYFLKTTLSYASGTMVVDGRLNCSNGAQVILYPYDENATEQHWRLIQNSDGSYYLSPMRNLNLNMSIEGGSTSNNAKVKLATANANDDSQKWYFERVDEASGVVTYQKYYLRNKYSGKYLDLQSNGTTNGTNFQQYSFGSSGYPSERFEFTGDTGYYRVKTTLTTGMVMDGRSNCVNGAQVILYSNTSNAPEQKWHLKRNEDDGTYCLSPAKNVDLNLSIQGASTANNAKVILETASYTTSSGKRIYADRQKWYLEPIDEENFGFRYMFSNEDEYSNISQSYSSNHLAIDIVGRNTMILGQSIISPVSGKVIFTDNDYSLGYYAVVETDTCWPGTSKKIKISFAHMLENSIAVTKDQRVIPGQKIGNVGATGSVQGDNPAHLHFSVFKNTNDTDYYVREYNSFNPFDYYPYVSFSFTGW